MLNDYCPIVPQLDPAAARIIRGTTQAFGPMLECLFVAAWDAETKSVHSPQLVARGNRAKVAGCTHRFPPGSVHLHSHPEHVSAVPSDGDVGLCDALAMLGVGMAVCTHDGSDLFVLTEPDAQIRRQTLVMPGRKLWSLGRLQFSWAPAAGGAR